MAGLLGWLRSVLGPPPPRDAPGPASAPASTTGEAGEEYWIKGEAQVNADGTPRQRIIKRCRVGDPITLAREPNNRYDRNAVAVLSSHGQIGYISREDAEDVARRLDWEEVPRCTISRILGGTRDKPHLGVVIAATWPEDWRTYARRVERQSRERSAKVLDLIRAAYAERDTDPEALCAAVAACERQIALGPRAARAFRRGSPDQPLPSHTGFKQLAIIREKQGDFAGAIELSRQAMQQGWGGDWGKRIERCERRAGKASR
jgi:hypothetical protein